MRDDSILLASFIHGTFNSQVYGIWRVIVPDAHPLLGGFGGLIGLAALAVIAGWAWKDRETLTGEAADCSNDAGFRSVLNDGFCF